ncbi:MAG TPA: hypothetical protein VK842_05445 [bacterium]|jgi:hypothetical protein|nr:hypothetical protein [bacterium]
MPHSLFRRLLIVLPLLGLGACAGLPLESGWSSLPVALSGDDKSWDDQKPVLLQDVDLRARNDGQFLYLRLASITEHVKDQWMGVYGQSLLLLFDPTGRQPLRQGLRLTLLPPPGTRPPWNPKDEPEYVWRSDDRVELVERRDDGSYQPRPIRQEDAAWEIHFKDQTLVYLLRVPLRRDHGWNLGLEPGRSLGLRIRTTDIDPHVAMALRPTHDGRVPSTSFRNSSLSLTNVAATGASLTAADGSTYDPSGSSGSIHETVALGGAPGVAMKQMAPYPAPVNVPDPIDLDLSLNLAPAR